MRALIGQKAMLLFFATLPLYIIKQMKKPKPYITLR